MCIVLSAILAYYFEHFFACSINFFSLFLDIAGTIPTEYGDLSTLEEMFLDSNRLAGAYCLLLL